MQQPSEAGLVLRIDAKVCHVEIDGARRQLPLAGKLFEQKSHEKRPLAVGDHVLLDASGAAIDSVLPRSSQLHRRAATGPPTSTRTAPMKVQGSMAHHRTLRTSHLPRLVDQG